MVYKVIGIMSGSSMDGLDIAYVQLEEVRGQWSYSILQAECLPYAEKWCHDLDRAAAINMSEFLRMHTRYGNYIGRCINEFIVRHELVHKVHFVASHGHTVFHDPLHRTTFQLGEGAAIAAEIGLPVISDLRNMDVALGGQGAPIVPIGDVLLFKDYDYLLNIGGIANITIQGVNPQAFDICAANQVLNALAQREGKAMDEHGALAASGVLLPEVLDELNTGAYYSQHPPKSLSNDAARQLMFPSLLESEHNTGDLLYTACAHVAQQVANALKNYPHSKERGTLLATGGGVFNTFLIERIQKELAALHIDVVIPDANVVKYKEALVMALIGTLRWREEVNVLRSVTGATRDSAGGALWLG